MKTPGGWDAVVVGAGPAGSSCAFRLARLGLRVLLLDRQSFPRDKPCGGALTIKALEAIPFDLGGTIRHRTDNLLAGRQFRREELVRSRAPTIAMTTRAELDARLLDAAVGEGVEFRKTGSISAVEETADQVSLHTPDGVLTAPVVIGADGANSTIRRLTGQLPKLAFGFALEGQVRRPAGERTVTFDFGVCPLGYGWLFPKGDHVNVGLYSADARFLPNDRQLRRYAAERLGAVDVLDIKGAPIPFGAHRNRTRPSRVLLVGDAGGFCEITLGEGLYYAIRTGQLAAEAVAIAKARDRPVGADFERLVAPVRRELGRANWIGVRFHSDIGLGHLAFTKVLGGLTMKGFALGVPLGDIAGQALRIRWRRWPAAVQARRSDGAMVSG